MRPMVKEGYKKKNHWSVTKLGMMGMISRNLKSS